MTQPTARIDPKSDLLLFSSIMLAISEYRRDGTLVVVLKGILDAETSPRTLEQLLQYESLGEKEIVIDGSALRYISSAGVRTVLRVSEHLKKTGGRLILAGLSPQNYRIFDLAGLIPVLQIFPSPDAYFGAGSNP